MAIDFSDYDSETLNEMRLGILAELEQRTRRDQLPEQIADMARAAVNAGVPAESIRSTVDEAIK